MKVLRRSTKVRIIGSASETSALLQDDSSDEDMSEHTRLRDDSAADGGAGGGSAAMTGDGEEEEVSWMSFPRPVKLIIANEACERFVSNPCLTRLSCF